MLSNIRSSEYVVTKDIKVADLPCKVSTLLFDFIDVSKDGYAIFDANDDLVYANYVYRDIFCLPQNDSQTVTFEEMLRGAYSQKRGINIEAEDIEQWLAYVRTVRRKRKFRIFEVDLVDGRWLLFSEQELPGGELLVQTKDMTRQKVLESQLKHSVQTLNKLALTDELTQLANRRSFVQSVEQDINRCTTDCCAITLLALDLDHFKNINDVYGHCAGDEALKHTARLLRGAIRQHDIVGRLGGEEFAIYLGATEVDMAIMVAERIRNIIASTPFSYEGQKITFTASIGVTTKSCQISFNALYTEADDALYQAKSNGRNRVEVYAKTQSEASSPCSKGKEQIEQQ